MIQRWLTAVFPVHVINNIEGVEVQLHSLLALAPDAGERSVSRSGCFTLRKIICGTHPTGYTYKKVNQSRYRPGVAQRVPGS